MSHRDPPAVQELNPDRDRLRMISRGVWLLPVFSVLTLWTTFEHQPDPLSEFSAWSQFVTTDRFLLQHVIGSIGGQALFALAVSALGAVLVLRSARPRQALWGVATGVIGSAGLLAGFGTAAFAQPALGDLQIDGYAGAQAVYENVYSPIAISVLLGGALLFALSTVLLARAAHTLAHVSSLGAWLFGVSGPLVGVFGIFVGGLQTVGAATGIAGGVLIARGVHKFATS
ncbi:hypothetical protein [Hoyosella subflava]|uniref:DUF4386 family protein n=1 Tax=Hoyosella subflava (strain DSM 45089 / JCM 17490 / NBRC 109087 / DQS3-9A1) TaxID=443218 RepID=F6EF65_HOYSD|nr:hypothetical protein [Hoyosella subflava]AEF38644.1 hypothetical protein AS9A_0184 [Hoyosella subflava DQS3-9A1]